MRPPFRGLATAAAIVLAAILATVRAPAADAPVYAATLTSLEDAPDGTAMGTVQPSTPLTVLERQNGWLKVELRGWSPAGGDRYVFREIGIRITEVVLTEGGLKYRKGGAKRQDDWGSDWQDTTVTGWVAAADTTDDLDSLWAQAGDLYLARCTRCHALHRPRELTANQWPQTLKMMTVRAGFTPPQAALVTMLLQVHAKDQDVNDAFTRKAASTSGEQQPATEEISGTPELAAQGAQAFEGHACNACHGDDAKTPIVPEYPRLAGQSAAYLYKQLLDFQSAKRVNDPDEAMKTAVEELSADDAKAIAYWLSTL